jgi:hypothetical protein
MTFTDKVRNIKNLEMGTLWRHGFVLLIGCILWSIMGTSVSIKNAKDAWKKVEDGAARASNRIDAPVNAQANLQFANAAKGAMRRNKKDRDEFREAVMQLDESGATRDQQLRSILLSTGHKLASPADWSLIAAQLQPETEKLQGEIEAFQELFDICIERFLTSSIYSDQFLHPEVAPPQPIGGYRRLVHVTNGGNAQIVVYDTGMEPELDKQYRHLMVSAGQRIDHLLGMIETLSWSSTR